MKRSEIVDIEPGKLKAVREKAGIAQIKVSKLMGYGHSELGRLENNIKVLRQDALDAFRKALGIEGTPLSRNEIKRYEKDLDEWRDLFILGGTKEVIEQHAMVVKAVEWSLSERLRYLYDIYCPMYYFVVNDVDALDKSLAVLKEREPDLNSEHRYWYYRMSATRKLMDYQYKSALKIYFEAAEMTKVIPPLIDGGPNGNISYCLSFMGYSSLAIAYLEKIQQKMDMVSNYKHIVSNKSLLALNYINVGRISEALAMLKGCLLDLTESDDLQIVKSGIYFNMAEAYMRMDDYDKAVESAGKACEHMKAGNGEYAYALYKKAFVLEGLGCIDECRQCLNEAEVISSSDETLTGLLIKTLKHSLSLDNEESMMYIEDVAIDKLKDRGLNLQLLHCYEKLSEYHGSGQGRGNKHKVSLTYMMLANTINKKLRNGDLDL